MNENFGLTFATPNFLEGMARVLDLGGTLTEYTIADNPRHADFLALRSDWRAIGEDFDTVLAQYELDEATYPSTEGFVMAPTLTQETETRPRTSTPERSLNPNNHTDAPKQGSAEWQTRLNSLGQRSRGTPLSPNATSREVLYEDASY